MLIHIVLVLIFDAIIPELPNRFHPTAWMGSFIQWALRFKPYGDPRKEFIFGTTFSIAGIILVAGVGYALLSLFSYLPYWIALVLEIYLLKQTISLRSLKKAARDVQQALHLNDLALARQLLARHLVSRNTSKLDASQLSGGAIESVAENASDGVVAPLFFYLLGGLPLALAYRFANTADSMVGYRDPGREWIGKFSARLDDVLNYLPARITAFGIVLAAYWVTQNGLRAGRILWRDARFTASPNAGAPMSAMAGALGVQLEKIDHYVLGREFPKPEPSQIKQACTMLNVSTVLALIFCLFFTDFLRQGGLL